MARPEKKHERKKGMKKQQKRKWELGRGDRGRVEGRGGHKDQSLDLTLGLRYN